ncbi:long-chain-fatty-acid--CoA ligase [Brevibacillus sp. SYP-B805]|uniref:class I adenylate-forming enzyme family protein n=1 Tax=Brevibacillus sp. SYP-B805 TaxID=1578199 RepID=UPI0013EC83D6|nr:long-chain-fatty-acid--CoA ligase [Brevibacillus sp. SYP-B805]NGQ93588.1 long-chain-fatty-acid--CoA ligase [Brevibacillus sp. SYP-B805]
MDIGSCLARNARRHPDKWALTCEGRSYTYGQFNREVNRLANGLQALGVQKGEKVALMMQNSDTFAISFFAAAKLGAVLVPVNFRLTSGEVRYILEHSDTSLVVCDAEYGDLIEEARPAAVKQVIVAGVPTVSGHLAYQQVLSENEQEPDAVVHERDDLEILYTSGTTGRPKGAVFDHHRILQVGVKMMALVGLQPNDRLLHLAPLFHSAQLNLLLLPGFFLGASHVIHRHFHPLEALKAMQEHKITFFFGVPTMYTYFLQVPNREQFDLSSVSRCAYGAAPMAPELVKQSMALFGTDQFYNFCGLTEGGPGGICLTPEDHKTKLGASGTAIFHTEARVVDDLDEDVPPGKVGELVLRGETMMKEYYKNPQATAETMRNGWLHTGDLAVIDENGYITLVDRKKDMIISGGENVYSVEVEQVLYAHPGVLEAAVIGVPHDVWGEMVAAVIVPKPGQTITLEELQSFCRKSLASYKIPRAMFLAEQLPRNASGKILKYKLREEWREHAGKSVS